MQESKKSNKRREVGEKLQEGETKKREIECMMEEYYFLCALHRESTREKMGKRKQLKWKKTKEERKVRDERRETTLFHSCT